MSRGNTEKAEQTVMFVLLLWYYGVWNRGLLSIFLCYFTVHEHYPPGLFAGLPYRSLLVPFQKN